MQAGVSLEKKLGYCFNNQNLLKQALTHRSYLNENPNCGHSHNERLEFLGDAVLELIVSEQLFTLFPDYDEGKLTMMRGALVKTEALATVAENLQLCDFLLLARGQAKTMVGKTRIRILADALEAIICAIYQDGGYEQVRIFINRHVLRLLSEIKGEEALKRPKNIVQEKIQERRGITSTYRLLQQKGPAHDKRFIVGLYLNNVLIAQGKGSSKKEAEHNAAHNALNGSMFQKTLGVMHDKQEYQQKSFG